MPKLLLTEARLELGKPARWTQANAEAQADRYIAQQLAHGQDILAHPTNYSKHAIDWANMMLNPDMQAEVRQVNLEAMLADHSRGHQHIHVSSESKDALVFGQASYDPGESLCRLFKIDRWFLSKNYRSSKGIAVGSVCGNCVRIAEKFRLVRYDY